MKNLLKKKTNIFQKGDQAKNDTPKQKILPYSYSNILIVGDDMATLIENFIRKNLISIETAIETSIPQEPTLPDIGSGLTPLSKIRL